MAQILPTPPLRVRRADPDVDWPRIWPFWQQIVAAGETHPYPLNATEAEAKALWLKPRRSTVFVAEYGLDIAAAMMTKPMREGNGDHVANFDLMVSPKFRRRGIGRTLAEYVIKACREDGYEAMEAYSVVASNTPAVRLWESLGFKDLGIAPDTFRLPGGERVGTHRLYMPLI